LLLVPAAAQAADTYVDQANGDNTNNCLTSVTACETISGGTGAAIKAGAGDTVFVVDPATQTTYAENVFLNLGKSLVALSPDSTETIIDNSALMGTTPAVFVNGAAGGTVEGFTIRSNFQGLLAQSPITVRDNIFDQATPPTNTLGVDIQIDASADGSLVTENEFVDPTPTAAQNQRGLFVGGASTITNNSFQDFVSSISAGGGPSSTPTISGNQISGVRVGSSAGVGISVSQGSPTIESNRIDGFVFGLPNDFVTGIFVNGPGAIGATLRRNVIIGPRFGITVEDTSGPVALEGDLVVQSRIHGLMLDDTAADDVGVADATATNVTIVDTEDATVPFEAEVVLFGANLTLDSGLIGNAAIDAQGSSVCTLTFSRGPTTSGNTCQNFQTSADPLFNDYHLTAASTLVDAGNPAAPPPGSLDIEGDPRALLGVPGCTLTAGRRDIGADEFVPATGIGCPAATTPPTTTPTTTPTSTGKKCKKKRRGKAGGASAAKKRCKKKRR
jgi:hypothetical protein